jgi:hypothetical protein
MSDRQLLDRFYAELEGAASAELLAELNEKFAELEGKKNKTEFSRCLTFFLLGRVYEKKFGKVGAT